MISVDMMKMTRNPIAKHMNTFNRPVSMKLKKGKGSYNRKEKHAREAE